MDSISGTYLFFLPGRESGTAAMQSSDAVCKGFNRILPAQSANAPQVLHPPKQMNYMVYLDDAGLKELHNFCKEKFPNLQTYLPWVSALLAKSLIKTCLLHRTAATALCLQWVDWCCA